jgi:L-aminopeptidase/D-esterase-like protein
MPALSLDTSAATAAANALTTATVRTTERPENEETKFVNIRFKESDHKLIGHLATDAGITKAAFCKAASLYLAEMVKAGAFTVNAGGFIDKRR